MSKSYPQVLADSVEVSTQIIISLENGRYNPSILLAYNISKVFEKSIEEVLYLRRNKERFLLYSKILRRRT